MLYSMLIFKRLASKGIASRVHKNIHELPSELLKRGIKCSENDSLSNRLEKGSQNYLIMNSPKNLSDSTYGLKFY